MGKPKMDNLYVVYVEDNNLYQVALTSEQRKSLNYYLQIILEKKLILFEEPLCKCSLVPAYENNERNW